MAPVVVTSQTSNTQLKMTKLLFSVLACLLFSPRLLAWNAEGHMVVAQIAYNHLNPSVKVRCDNLIAVSMGTNSSSGTSNLVTAAVWADDFRTPLGTANWHFINYLLGLDSPTNGVAFATFDVVRAINTNIAVLQNNSATVSNQAAHLRYLLHFVGDIHQPLHCVAAISSVTPNGDAGGNGFGITGNWSNLHALWDEGGGYLSDFIARPLTSTGQAILSNKVVAIETSYPYSPNPGTVPDPTTWAQEGLAAAQNVVYAGIVRSNTPSAGYLNTAQATAEARLAYAGHRLADLLNTIMAPSPIVLGSLTTTNGSFRFSWSSSPAVTYRVQTKSNLTDPTWGEITSIIASSNVVSFSEALTDARRFYRVVQ